MGIDILQRVEHAAALVVRTEDGGAEARARVGDDGQSIEVTYGAADATELELELVFRFDPGSRRLTLRAPGDLELSAPHGAVAIKGKDVRLTGDHEVRCRGERVAVRADDLDVRVGTARWWAERWELRADQARTSARDLVQSVEKRFELHAGHLRQRARDVFEMLSDGRTRLRSKGDTHIDGERVRLG